MNKVYNIIAVYCVKFGCNISKKCTGKPYTFWGGLDSKTTTSLKI